MARRDAVLSISGRSVLLLLLLQGTSALGAQTAPAAPPVTAYPGDKSFTVAWSEPAGATGIAAYDVRWILTSADETVDSNWTLIDNAWTSGGLYEVVTGLTNDTEYDVQVRAVAASDGAWSATVEKVTPSDTSHPLDLAIDTAAVAVLPDPGIAIGGVLDDSSDKDGYRFVLARGMMVSLRSSGIPGSTGTLYGKSPSNTFTAYAVNPPAAAADKEIVWKEPLGPGSYALGVTPSTTLGSATAYEIHWDPEPLEKDLALPFALDGSVEGVIGVRGKGNWYRIVLAAQTDLFLWSIPGLHRYHELSQPLENLSATLYDSGGTSVAGSSVYGLPEQAGHFVIRKNLAAGTYHLHVEGPPLPDLGGFEDAIFRRQTHSGAYTVFANSAAAEAGNTTSSATPVPHEPSATPLRPVGGRIGSRDDVDFFRVRLTSGGYMIAGVASKDVALDVSLVDSQGNPVATAEYTLSFPANLRAVWLANRLEASDYYVRVASRSGTGAYWLLARGNAADDLLHSSCTVDETIASDDLYSCQWHLPVVKARETWTTHNVMGTGITVAIVDDGLEEGHLDLLPNVDTKAGRDYAGAGLQRFFSHGTRVAGLVAARDNDIGVRGVAPRATIHGRNWLLDQSDAALADAMLNGASTTAISNNSWGALGYGTATPAAAVWKRAVRQGLKTGWGGKGTVYVFAAGNGAQSGSQVNLSELTTHYGVVAVCGTGPDGTRAPYSETGATLWVCAPTHADNDSMVLTTGDLSRYDARFGGTSSAAPILAGVVALVREANAELTWRDVKLILAGSAVKTDASNSGWIVAGPKHEDSSSSYNYNDEYGFGRVDAKAAVELAKAWPLLPQFIETKAVRVSPNQVIEDASENFDGKLVQSETTIDDEIEFIEFVEVEIDMQTWTLRDLELELVSPGGKVTKLSSSYRLGRHPTSGLQLAASLSAPFSFGSARYMGESPEGVWRLRVQDVIPPDPGLIGGPGETRLKSWSLRFYGHRKTPGAPAVTLHRNYGQLTAAWSAPSVTGASAVTGYRLRWATETDADAGQWTTVDDAGTGGSKREVVDDLTDGTRYAVQVQGINAQGSGRWSALKVGVPGAPPPPGGGTGGGGDDGDGDGGDDDDGDDPPPPATAPTAAIGVDVACADGLCRALTGAPVRFEDRSTGTVRYRLWDFHGGSTSRQATVSHAFESPGFYDVSLTVSLDGERESVASLRFLVEAAHPAGTCQATDTTLCLRDSRYEVSLGWWTADGQSGDATVVRKGTNDSGLFWFFADDNWEMLVKVLDGCSYNGRHWVYAASATNLGYELRVRDTVTDDVKEYRNEPGMPSPAVADSSAFAAACSGPL